MKKPTGGGRIVADKRNFDQAPQKMQKQQAAPPRKPPRPPRRGNFLTRGISGLMSLVAGGHRGSFWRLGLTVAALVFAATFYFYTTCPRPRRCLTAARAARSPCRTPRAASLPGAAKPSAWSAPTRSPGAEGCRRRDRGQALYSHFGISPRGIASAVRINMAEGRGPLEGNGGSTITQQVAKLLCLGETFDPPAGSPRPSSRPNAASPRSGARSRKSPIRWPWRPNIRKRTSSTST